MRAGHRWVRIDPAGLRRARALLDEQMSTKSTVGAVDLLRLSAGHSPDGETPVELVADPTTRRRRRRERRRRLDPLAARGAARRAARGGAGVDGFVGELRHYQRRGLAWMQFLARVGLGGCLADDMGLGKTATTLAHLVERPGPHLVVCPLSVVHNWEAEARRFTPGLTVVVHHGAGRQQGAPALFGLADADIVVTTYGLLPRDIDALATIDWTTVVLDEAQMVKNSEHQGGQGGPPAPRRAEARAHRHAGREPAVASCGRSSTPSTRACSAASSEFREQYARRSNGSNDPEVAARLRRLTQPFVLRRTKADRRLLPDLPDKIEQIAFAQLTQEQATLYQQVVDQLLVDAKDLEGMQRRGRVLAALTRLKQICNHPAHALKDGSRLAGRSGKLNRFDELVTELLDVDERALVFTQFREMGDLLQTHLRDRFGIDAPFLHGGVSRAGRDRMVAEFQAGDGSPLLLVSLKAGGTGLNLTAASQVIHYDRWWNPAVEDQATDRAWRHGSAAHGQRAQAGLSGHGRGTDRSGDRREAGDRRRGDRHAARHGCRSCPPTISPTSCMLEGRMSRPRKPYGPNPPGRLFGTMIKVLAAEMSDQGRLSRGKRYWADDAVVDIVVGHGAVTAEIQGSRPRAVRGHDRGERPGRVCRASATSGRSARAPTTPGPASSSASTRWRRCSRCPTRSRSNPSSIDRWRERRAARPRRQTVTERRE